MQATYSITTEPRRHLVRMTLAGFFTPDDVARFDAERIAVQATLTCPPCTHVTLCDASKIAIQTQEVVAAFAAVAADPRYRARRLAMVTAPSLARLQTRRATDNAAVAYFTTVEAAEAWLFAADVAGQRDAA